MRFQFGTVRHELSLLRDLQLEVHARSAYMQLLQKFIDHEPNVEWKKLDGHRNLELTGEEVNILLPRGQERFSTSYRIAVEDKKKKNDRADFRLLDVEITFAPVERPDRRITYYYQMATRRLVSGKGQPDDALP